MSSDIAPVTYHIITFDQLLDFALGKLDPAARQQISRHLAEGCRQCEAELARAERVLDATRNDLPAEPPSWVVHRAKQLFVRHEVEKVPRLDRLAAFLMDTQTIVGAIVVAAVIIVTLTGAYVWQRIPSAQTASLQVIANPVEVQSTSDGDWAPAGNTVKLGAGMALRTRRAGTAKLTFPDDSVLELGDNSLIRFDALHTLTGVGPQVVRLEQSSGLGRYQIAAGGPGGGFDIRTPVAQIQGRDTQYDLSVDEDGTTTIQVHAGTVNVSAGDRSVSVTAGQLLVISPTAPAAPLQPSPFPPTPTSTASPTFTATSRAPAVVPAPATETPTPTMTLSVTAPRQSAPPAGPTDTPVPTATDVPTLTPSLTPSPVPTLTPSFTPVPPTAVPPTDTPKPPTDTPKPPTDTPVPPTDTPVPPTDTPVPPPTDTPAPTAIPMPTKIEITIEPPTPSSK